MLSHCSVGWLESTHHDPRHSSPSIPSHARVCFVSMLNDGSIVERVLAGDHEQFAQIVDRYRPALYRLAVARLGQPDWAEDAVQETFLCAYKSLHTYNSRFSFRTWLWTILLNQCRRHLKRIQKWSTSEAAPSNNGHPLGADALLGREMEPVDRVLADERLQTLEIGLRSLSVPQADAIRLRFFGHLKFQEIADAQSCSLSTAKNRVREGLVALSDQLTAEYSVDSQLDGSCEVTPTAKRNPKA